MALLTFQNVTISALAAAVPKRVFNNLTDNPFFSQEDVTAIVEKTGVYQRRIVADGVCASDLCYHATKELLSRACIDPTEIDAMIFVSQHRITGCRRHRLSCNTDWDCQRVVRLLI